MTHDPALSVVMRLGTIPKKGGRHGLCKQRKGLSMIKTQLMTRKRTTLATCVSLMSLLAISMFSGNALAQPGPVPYLSGCPSGYSQSGKYCVPRPGAGHAIRYNSGCPSGYSQSGKYCVARSPKAYAIPYSGGCPSGYSQSGKFCVRR